MELAKNYDPKEHEQRIYQAWKASGGVQPHRRRPDAEPFTIMIPPPNVTGVLHMGHALNNSIQDIVIRHRRMQGFEALWLPGLADSAALRGTAEEWLLLRLREQSA